MADNYKLNGSATVEPASGSPSLAEAAAAPLTEALSLKNWTRKSIVLSGDTAVVVALDSLASVHVLILKVKTSTTNPGVKAKATVTSADGSAQVVPFDYLIWSCQNVPLTALSLTRVAGTATEVEVFFGEKA